MKLTNKNVKLLIIFLMNYIFLKGCSDEVKYRHELCNNNTTLIKESPMKSSSPCKVYNKLTADNKKRIKKVDPYLSADPLTIVGEYLTITYRKWEGNNEKLTVAARLSKGLKIVKELLESGNVNINYKDCNGWTALHYAVFNNNKEIVESLLKNGADANETNNGCTALKLAIENQNKEILELLLQNNVNVNTIIKIHCHNSTNLICAIKNGNKDIAESLLLAGADINAIDEYGCTALKYAREYGLEEIKQLLLSYSNPDNSQSNCCNIQ